MQPETELWVYDGGAVKSLDDKGRIGGHLIVWGDSLTPDATAWRDYFTPETDLGRFVKAGPIDLIFHHDLPTVGKGKDGGPIANHLAGRELGEVKATADDVGLWVEGIQHVRDEYEEAVKDMVRAGKLSWSSGAVSHRVVRQRQPNGAHKVMRWHVVEASLTPTPGEPRTRAVALKSLLEESPPEGGPAAGPETPGPAVVPVPDGALARLCGEAESAWLKFVELATHRAEVRGRESRPLSAGDRQAVERVLTAWGGRHEELKALLTLPKLEPDAEPPKSVADLAAMKARREAQLSARSGALKNVREDRAREEAGGQVPHRRHQGHRGQGGRRHRR
jgi:hypothetical protein